MAELPVRASNVQIVKSFQAVCYRGGCLWTGDLRSTHQAANDDRLRHLAEHADRLDAPEEATMPP